MRARNVSNVTWLILCDTGHNYEIICKNSAQLYLNNSLVADQIHINQIISYAEVLCNALYLVADFIPLSMQ